MKKLQVEQDLQKEKFSGLIVLGLFVVVGLLALGRVFMANRLVETSQSLKNMDQKIAELETQNEVLSEQLRSEESIVAVESKITALGFTPVSRLAYLSRPVEVAYKW